MGPCDFQVRFFNLNKWKNTETPEAQNIFFFRKLQAELGGNVEFMITGAAPISGEVLEMCRIALGCVIVEGYGRFTVIILITIHLIIKASGVAKIKSSKI